MDRPDRKGRKQILEVHTRGKPLAKEIDLDALAGQTPGFTGADLANLINESALLTARTGKREISMDELEEGIMRVIAGPEKKTRVMSEKERLVTAFHEMGHAIVGQKLPNCDPVHKISIIGRGQALGYTISLPGEDKFLTTRAELGDTMAMTLGGRAAEEIVFGEITTGASNDLEKVTATAKQMVMRFGMSERLGPRVFGHDRGQPFLGREFSSEPDYSDEIAREIDDEIRRIVEEAHQTAKDILTENREHLDRISKILLERETIDAKEFEALLEGKTEEEVFPRRGGGRTPRPSPRQPAEAEQTAGREGPRPVTRPAPGFAGGSAEMRADQLAAAVPCRPCGSWASSTSRPDSFSDGGLYLDADAAIAHGRELLAEGADILDVGGESTRPGAAAVPADEELRRTEPVVRALAGDGATVSIDTSKVAVAEAALDAGAAIVNDVTAFAAEPELADLCADRGCGVVLMHMQGTPRTMQENPTYDDVVDDVKAFLAERVEFAVARGVAEERDLDRSRDRLRQDRRAQPGAAAAARRAARAGPSDPDRDVAQELPRQAHRPRRSGAARRHDRLERDRARERRRDLPRPRRPRGPRGADRRPRRFSGAATGASTSASRARPADGV